MQDLEKENQELKEHCKRLQEVIDLFQTTITKLDTFHFNHLERITFDLTATVEEKEIFKNRNLNHIQKAKERYNNENNENNENN